MSKGQRGNKEAKKPKRVATPAVPGAAAVTVAAVPGQAARILERAKKR